ncbi:Hok/Gef family protein [Providencia sneebia]|uniref:Post-segregation killing protein n=1 Tax=Providencia sneebia DSM 19967 TaxID=1141660 RepID=K8WL28_9GAMM|nr:Hok/Gef family protein [Providencia sneebia]EKT61259.1 post-segregation killing protein [Providencia sneebia DSM 19967]
MTKYALNALIVVCVTILCFVLLTKGELCSFSYSSGNTVVQAER